MKEKPKSHETSAHTKIERLEHDIYENTKKLDNNKLVTEVNRSQR